VNDIDRDGADAQVEALFRGLNTALDGECFTAGVMRRIRRRILVRQVILSSAAAVGTAVAAVPFAQLLSWVSAALVSMSAQSWSLFLIDSMQPPLVLFALVLSGIGALNWLAR